MFKKSYSSIMSGFIKAKEELGVYIKGEVAETIKQEQVGAKAVKLAKISMNNARKAENTINQLDKILG